MNIWNFLNFTSEKVLLLGLKNGCCCPTAHAILEKQFYAEIQEIKAWFYTANSVIRFLSYQPRASNRRWSAFHAFIENKWRKSPGNCDQTIIWFFYIPNRHLAPTVVLSAADNHNFLAILLALLQSCRLNPIPFSGTSVVNLSRWQQICIP